MFRILSVFMFLLCLGVHVCMALMFLPLLFIHWVIIPPTLFAWALCAWMFHPPMREIWYDMIEG